MVRIKPKTERTEVRCNLCDVLIGWEKAHDELETWERDEDESLAIDFNIEANGWMNGYMVDGSKKNYPFDYCPICAPIVIKALKEIKLTRREMIE